MALDHLADIVEEADVVLAEVDGPRGRSRAQDPTNVIDVVLACADTHLRGESVQAPLSQRRRAQLARAATRQDRPDGRAACASTRSTCWWLCSLDPVELCVLRVVASEELGVDLRELAVLLRRGLVRPLVEPVGLVDDQEIPGARALPNVERRQHHLSGQPRSPREHRLDGLAERLLRDDQADPQPLRVAAFSGVNNPDR